MSRLLSTIVCLTAVSVAISVTWAEDGPQLDFQQEPDGVSMTAEYIADTEEDQSSERVPAMGPGPLVGLRVERRMDVIEENGNLREVLISLPVWPADKMCLNEEGRRRAAELVVEFELLAAEAARLAARSRALEEAWNAFVAANSPQEVVLQGQTSAMAGESR